MAVFTYFKKTTFCNNVKQFQGTRTRTVNEQPMKQLSMKIDKYIDELNIQLH